MLLLLFRLSKKRSNRNGRKGLAFSKHQSLHLAADTLGRKCAVKISRGGEHANGLQNHAPRHPLIICWKRLVPESSRVDRDIDH